MARRTKTFTLGVAGSVDEQTILETESIQGCDAFCINTTAGTARVFASIARNGTYLTKQLVLCEEPPNSGDTISSQDPVFVGVTTVNIPAWFYGDYTKIKVVQESATPVTGHLIGAGDRF